MSSNLKTFTREEVAKHNKVDDLWIIIDSKVYDLTKFVKLHPGGVAALTDTHIAGEDATDAFFSLHKLEVLQKPQYQRLQIGTIANETSVIRGYFNGGVSEVPFAEPTWLSPGYYSPYFNESHRKFQKACRAFWEDEIFSEAWAREEDGKAPSKLVYQKLAEKNMTAMRLGPGKHLQGRVLLDGAVKPEEFDYFHELIISQEMCRSTSRGYGDALNAGALIGLPPVLNFGSEELKAKVIPEVLDGKKFICLAISEAFAGSDVMGLQTTAVKTEDGKHWIINGHKKWITNGRFADYFTTGCKTEDGFTVILVERGPGLETTQIRTGYSVAAGTALVTYDNVKVPVENTLGEEGGGIFVMLSNFNHERWVMTSVTTRSQRLVVEEVLKWVNQRKVFGSPLHSQAVVRAKIAAMISRAETCQAWVENITYQMCNMSYNQQAGKLAGQIGLLKSYVTQCAQDTARDAVQIFGGRGITKTGMGRLIHHFYQTIPFDAILGGAEDVLADLGARQAIRGMPRNVRL